MPTKMFVGQKELIVGSAQLLVNYCQANVFVESGCVYV